MSVTSYRDLEVWQSGMALVTRIYRVTDALPGDERYGLSSQMRRAAVSVPSNIAEGWSRRTTRLFRRHVSIARGSLAELETQLLICIELGYVEEARLCELLSSMTQLAKQLNSLESSLAEKLKAS